MIGKILGPTLFISLIFFIVGCSKTNTSWTILFDGQNVTGMRGFKMGSFPWGGWAIENGTLKTLPEGDHIDIITTEQYKNFELELEWKVSAGGNSGIFHHGTETNYAIWQSAPEMQVLDDGVHHDGKNTKTSAGALYGLIAPANKTLKPVGEFNRVKISAQNNHIEYWLNDSKVIEFELKSPALAKLIVGSKFRDMPNFAQADNGHIGLQHHGEEVWFRNIRIRKL